MGEEMTLSELLLTCVHPEDMCKSILTEQLSTDQAAKCKKKKEIVSSSQTYIILYPLIKQIICFSFSLSNQKNAFDSIFLPAKNPSPQISSKVC